MRYFPLLLIPLVGCGTATQPTSKPTPWVATCPAPTVVKAPTYTELRAKAVRENKPLLVWVGQVCPACEKSMSDYVHFRAPSGWWKVEGPAVILSLPKDGELWWHATIDGCPTKAELRRMVDAFYAPPVSQAPPPQQYIPQMNFGGGGRGGGC